MNHTLEDLVSFALLNRGSKVFKGWSETQIGNALFKAIGRNELVFSTSPEGRVNGLVLASSKPEEKTLHIIALLTTSKGVIPRMLLKYREWFPGFTLTAERRGRFVVYKNTPRFCRLLESFS